MTNIRWYDAGSHPVFMTTVCSNRSPYLRETADKELLLAVMREVKKETPYVMMGYVILDDHFHWMLRFVGLTKGLSGGPKQRGPLTYGEMDVHDNPRYKISILMQSVKLRFTRRYKKITGWMPRYRYGNGGFGIISPEIRRRLRGIWIISILTSSNMVMPGSRRIMRFPLLDNIWNAGCTNRIGG